MPSTFASSSGTVPTVSLLRHTVRLALFWLNRLQVSRIRCTPQRFCTMSLHCYVIPQALAAHAGHVVHRVRHAFGIGRHGVAHTTAGAVPHVAPAAAPPVSCSAPVQALRAMRALAGAPAAALVAGGMTLGGLGAGLAGAGAPAAPYASAGGSGGGFVAGSNSYTPRVVTANAAQQAPAATPADMGVATPGSMVTAGTPTVSTPSPSTPFQSPAPAMTPDSIPDFTPADTPPVETNAAPPSPVPEPEGLAWFGMAAATGAGLAVRRLPHLRRSD